MLLDLKYMSSCQSYSREPRAYSCWPIRVLKRNCDIFGYVYDSAVVRDQRLDSDTKIHTMWILRCSEQKHCSNCNARRENVHFVVAWSPCWRAGSGTWVGGRVLWAPLYTPPLQWYWTPSAGLESTVAGVEENKFAGTPARCAASRAPLL